MLSGRSELSLQATGSPAHPFETLEGTGSVRAAEGSFYNQAFHSMDVTYQLTPGRLHISEGIMRFEAGVLVVHGRLGFVRLFSDSDDKISLRLHQMPVPFTDQGPTALSTITLLDGEVTARGTGSGQVRVDIDLDLPQATHQVRQGGQALRG